MIILSGPYPIYSCSVWWASNVVVVVAEFYNGNKFIFWGNTFEIYLKKLMISAGWAKNQLGARNSVAVSLYIL